MERTNGRIGCFHPTMVPAFKLTPLTEIRKPHAPMILTILPQNSRDRRRPTLSLEPIGHCDTQILTNFMLSLFCLWTRITALMACRLPHRVLYLASAGAAMTCRWGGGEGRGTRTFGDGRDVFARRPDPQRTLAARSGCTAGSGMVARSDGVFSQSCRFGVNDSEVGNISAVKTQLTITWMRRMCSVFERGKRARRRGPQW